MADRAYGPPKEPQPGDQIIYTKDHPEACGAQPLPGAVGYSFSFPRDTGGYVWIRCGQHGYDALRGLIAQIEADNDA